MGERGLPDSRNHKTPLSGLLFGEWRHRANVANLDREQVKLVQSTTSMLARVVRTATALPSILALGSLLSIVSPALGQTGIEACQDLEPGNREECMEGVWDDEAAPSYGVDSLANSRAVTCIGTEEDLYSPSARAMNWARATPSTQLQLRQPRRWQFQWSDNTITVDGKPVTPLMIEGNVAVVRVTDAMGAVQDPRAQYLSPEEQRQWEGVMKFMHGLQGQIAQATGLQDRLFLIDFDTARGMLGTLAGSDLADRQQMTCF